MAEITDLFGKASIDSDYAVATTVTAERTAGVTVLDGFDLSKFTEDTPVFFITYKKTTDPLTGDVSVTDLVSYKGLVNSGANTITNLTAAPGYVDIGNDIGDFIECIPTSYWVNSLIDGLFVSLTPEGEIKADAPVDSPQESLANITPVGSVLDFAGSVEPTGWLLCYGQAISRVTYADLFAVLSTTYGIGDGSTTFNLPDLRGRVVAGQDDMGGVSANRLAAVFDGDVLGGAGGAEQINAAHTHTYSTGNMVNLTSGVAMTGGSSNINHRHDGTTNSGGDSTQDNVQPTIILNKIIKY